MMKPNISPMLRGSKLVPRMSPSPAIAMQASGTNVRMIHQCRDRKSTRLNSSHQIISYAVFCLKKKRVKTITAQTRRTLDQVHPDCPLPRLQGGASTQYTCRVAPTGRPGPHSVRRTPSTPHVEP